MYFSLPVISFPRFHERKIITINVQMLNLAVYFLGGTVLLSHLTPVNAWESLETCQLPNNMAITQGWGFNLLDPPFSSSSDLSRSLNSLVNDTSRSDSTWSTGAMNLDFTILCDDPRFSDPDGLEFMQENLHTTSMSLAAQTNFKPKISGEYTFTIETIGGAAMFEFQTLPDALCCENVYQDQYLQKVYDGRKAIKVISSDGLRKTSSLTINLEGGVTYFMAVFYVNLHGDANLKFTVTLPTGENVTDFTGLSSYMKNMDGYKCDDTTTTLWEYSPWTQTYNSTYSTSTTSKYEYQIERYKITTVYYVYTSTASGSSSTASVMPLSIGSSAPSYHSTIVSSATASTTPLSTTKSEFSSISEDAIALSRSDHSTTASFPNSIDTVAQRSDSADVEDIVSTVGATESETSAKPVNSDNLDGIGRSKDVSSMPTGTKTHIATNTDNREVLSSEVTQDVDSKTEKSDISDTQSISSTGGFRNDTDVMTTSNTATNAEALSQTNSKLTAQTTTGGYDVTDLDNRNGIDADARTGVSGSSLSLGNVADGGRGSDENLQDVQSGLQAATPGYTNANNNIPDNSNNAGHSVSKSPEHVTNVASEPGNNAVQQGSGYVAAESNDANNTPNSAKGTRAPPQSPNTSQSLIPSGISLKPYGTDQNGIVAVESSQVSAINGQSPTVVVSAVPNIAGRLNTVLSVASVWILLTLLVV